MSQPLQLFPENDRRFLPGYAHVWRYVPLRTLFFYLNGLVFLPSVAKLKAGDPFEGEFYEDIVWFNGAFHDSFGNDAAMIQDWIFKTLCSESERAHIELNKKYLNAAAEVFHERYFDFINRTRFAWCWFQSSRESAAMWSVYGNQGVAVQSTVESLNAMLQESGRKFSYGKLTYVDYQYGSRIGFNPERDTDKQLLLRPYFLKRKEYESENEVRWVTAAAERGEKNGIMLREVKPHDWIKAIRLWPGLTVDEEGSLKASINRVLPDIDCQKSDLFTGPDSRSGFIEMFSAQLEDSADSKWNDGSDGIPGRLKEIL